MHHADGGNEDGGYDHLHEALDMRHEDSGLHETLVTKKQPRSRAPLLCYRLDGGFFVSFVFSVRWLFFGLIFWENIPPILLSSSFSAPPSSSSSSGGEPCGGPPGPGAAGGGAGEGLWTLPGPPTAPFWAE